MPCKEGALVMRSRPCSLAVRLSPGTYFARCHSQAKAMHDEDNRYGLHVSNAKGEHLSPTSQNKQSMPRF